MYLGSWKIDDYLTIPITTHRFSSGAAYAATTISYRIYEDNTNTEIVADTGMSNFDAETGMYLGRLALAAATGFEKGKCYTVLTKATVDGVEAIHVDTLQIEAEVDTNTVSATINDSSGVTELLTRVPDATAGANGGLLIAGSNAATTFATLTSTGAFTVGSIVNDGIFTQTGSHPFATPVNITAGTITTVSNLTNAPTNGDFTSTMKNSLNASTPAGITDKAGFSLADNQINVTIGTVTTVSDKANYTLHSDYNAAKTAATQTSVNTIDTIVDIMSAILRNKLVIDNSTGNGILYADDNFTPLYEVSGLITDTGTITIRKRLE